MSEKLTDAEVRDIIERLDGYKNRKWVYLGWDNDLLRCATELLALRTQATRLKPATAEVREEKILTDAEWAMLSAESRHRLNEMNRELLALRAQATPEGLREEIVRVAKIYCPVLCGGMRSDLLTKPRRTNGESYNPQHRWIHDPDDGMLRGFFCQAGAVWDLANSGVLMTAQERDAAVSAFKEKVSHIFVSHIRDLTEPYGGELVNACAVRVNRIDEEISQIPTDDSALREHDAAERKKVWEEAILEMCRYCASGNKALATHEIPEFRNLQPPLAGYVRFHNIQSEDEPRVLLVHCDANKLRRRAEEQT